MNVMDLEEGLSARLRGLALGMGFVGGMYLLCGLFCGALGAGYTYLTFGPSPIPSSPDELPAMVMAIAMMFGAALLCFVLGGLCLLAAPQFVRLHSKGIALMGAMSATSSIVIMFSGCTILPCFAPLFLVMGAIGMAVGIFAFMVVADPKLNEVWDRDDPDTDVR